MPAQAAGMRLLRRPAGQTTGFQNDFRRVVRSRGLEPPRVAPLAPQASASTNSATTAGEAEHGRRLPRAAPDVTNRPPSDKGLRGLDAKEGPVVGLSEYAVCDADVTACRRA